MKHKDTSFLEGLFLGFLIAGLWFTYKAYNKQTLPENKTLSSLKKDSYATILLDPQKEEASKEELKSLNERFKKDLKKLRKSHYNQNSNHELSTTSYKDTSVFNKPFNLELGNIYPVTEYNTPENPTLDDEIEEKLDRERFKKELYERREKAFVKAFIEDSKERGYTVVINKYLEIVSVRRDKR